MLTFQDLETVNHDNQNELMSFIRMAITQHETSPLYKTAKVAEQYMKKRNKTILEFQKMIFNAAGRAIPDNYSANYKLGRAFFPFFVTQENQYLLSNGVNWENEETGDKLGTKKKPFDRQLMKAGKKALVGGVSFGFFNLDHLDVFGISEFVPLYDEDNGSLRAGIRFWQIDHSKPLRATLYEEDGYTEFIWNQRKINAGNGLVEYREESSVLQPKRAYILKMRKTDIDNEVIYEGENYPTFPIVPLYGNDNHQSEFVGLQEQIDTYDLIKSGFCNNVEEASYVFWAISNAGGMDDSDLAKFVKRVRTIHAAVTEDNGAEARAQTVDTPYQGREVLLDRLEKDIFKDAMAFDPETVTSGGATATQIRSAYENLKSKTDDYEYCIIDFVNSILEIAGIDDNPTFTRTEIANVNETINTVLAAADHLSSTYVTTKIATLLGDGDHVESILEEMSEDELKRGDALEIDDLSDEEETDEEFVEEEVNEPESGDNSDLEGIISQLKELLEEA